MQQSTINGWLYLNYISLAEGITMFLNAHITHQYKVEPNLSSWFVLHEKTLNYIYEFYPLLPTFMVSLNNVSCFYFEDIKIVGCGCVTLSVTSGHEAGTLICTNVTKYPVSVLYHRDKSSATK